MKDILYGFIGIILALAIFAGGVLMGTGYIEKLIHGEEIATEEEAADEGASGSAAQETAAQPAAATTAPAQTATADTLSTDAASVVGGTGAYAAENTPVTAQNLSYPQEQTPSASSENGETGDTQATVLPAAALFDPAAVTDADAFVKVIDAILKSYEIAGETPADYTVTQKDGDFVIGLRSDALTKNLQPDADSALRKQVRVRWCGACLQIYDAMLLCGLDAHVYLNILDTDTEADADSDTVLLSVRDEGLVLYDIAYGSAE